MTVSAWIAEAARDRVRNLVLGKVIDEVIAEMGWEPAELERLADEAERSATWTGSADGREEATA
jgi:hypothetical protein